MPISVKLQNLLDGVTDTAGKTAITKLSVVVKMSLIPTYTVSVASRFITLVRANLNLPNRLLHAIGLLADGAVGQALATSGEHR